MKLPSVQVLLHLLTVSVYMDCGLLDPVRRRRQTIQGVYFNFEVLTASDVDFGHE